MTKGQTTTKQDQPEDLEAQIRAYAAAQGHGTDTPDGDPWAYYVRARKEAEAKTQRRQQKKEEEARFWLYLQEAGIFTGAESDPTLSQVQRGHTFTGAVRDWVEKHLEIAEVPEEVRAGTGTGGGAQHEARAPPCSNILIDM